MSVIYATALGRPALGSRPCSGWRSSGAWSPLRRSHLHDGGRCGSHRPSAAPASAGQGSQDPSRARGAGGHRRHRRLPRLSPGTVGSYTCGDPLFVRLVGSAEAPEAQPFSRQSLDRLVLSWFRRAGVTPPPGALAHALRHTYATLLVDAGASLPEVQALLGHKDMSTTQVYLKVAGRGLKDAARAHPARQALQRAGTGPASPRDA